MIGEDAESLLENSFQLISVCCCLMSCIVSSISCSGVRVIRCLVLGENS